MYVFDKVLLFKMMREHLFHFVFNASSIKISPNQYSGAKRKNWIRQLIWLSLKQFTTLIHAACVLFLTMVTALFWFLEFMTYRNCYLEPRWLWSAEVWMFLVSGDYWSQTSVTLEFLSEVFHSHLSQSLVCATAALRRSGGADKRMFMNESWWQTQWRVLVLSLTLTSTRPTFHVPRSTLVLLRLRRHSVTSKRDVSHDRSDVMWSKA